MPLLTIAAWLSVGFAVGLLIGLFLTRPKFGCLALLAVPVAMIFVVIWSHGADAENLRSTSGLDFIFGPLWPSLGALPGYLLGMLLKSLFDRRR